MASTRGQRIEAYCKIIWGAERSYDIEAEQHDDDYYFMVIREDRGTSFGNPLTFTGFIKGSDRAWNELEKHVASLAKAVETEGWVPKEKPLDAAAYPSAQHEFDANAESLLRLLNKNKAKN